MTDPVENRPPRAAGPPHVLVVCLANRFRSPLAEHLLRRALADRDLAWTVSSAGVGTGGGRVIDADVARLLAGYDIVAADSWVSTRLTAEGIEAADLVLTADVARGRDVTDLVPSALHRTFPVRRLSRLLAACRPDDLRPGDDGVRAVLAAARRARARSQPVADGVDDLPDPVNRPLDELARCAAEIHASVQVIADAALAVSTAPSGAVSTAPPGAVSTAPPGAVSTAPPGAVSTAPGAHRTI